MSRLSLKNDFKDGEVLYGNQINTNNNATVAAVNDNYEEIQKLQTLKADVANVDSQMATKVDVSTFNDAINSLTTTKANVSLVNTKADKSELETKADKNAVEQSLATKADTSYVDTQLGSKADTSYVNTQLNLKADKATTYTKDETDAAVSSAITSKADVAYVNNQLSTKANASDLGNLTDLETTNKSSAVAAINELKNEGSIVSNIDGMTITRNENNAIQTIGVIDKNGEETSVKTWTGTKEEYDALETKDASTLYYITDDYEEPEVKSNKVTDINSTNTDEEYPSAKAVYDAIQDVSGGGGNVPIATTEVAGKVKPDGTTITVDTDGTIHSVGGSGGTTDYELLINKPQINGVTLEDNKSLADLGIKQTYTADDITFTDGETFQQKYDAGELTGPQGPAGADGLQGPAGQDGVQGPAGADATINGQNTLNILAGTNISLDQQGTNLTINATGGSGGGATYTAGTNIEITEDNVINNTIPYNNVTFYSMSIGNKASTGSTNYSTALGIGSRVDASYSVAIGANASVKNSSSYNSVVIGSSASCFSSGIAIGTSAQIDGSCSNCIVLGAYAKPNKSNQFMLGSNSFRINEIAMTTTDGIKTVVTTDVIEALEARIVELESKVAALEGGSQ